MRCCLSFFALVTCAALAVGFLGNHVLHNGIEGFEHSLHNINDVILIVLDDIERSFESEEDSLASLTLKICLSSSPIREGVAALRHWTYNNKIYSAEVHACQLDRESLPSSDNVTFQSVSSELFRSVKSSQFIIQTVESF